MIFSGFHYVILHYFWKIVILHSLFKRWIKIRLKNNRNIKNKQNQNYIFHNQCNPNWPWSCSVSYTSLLALGGPPLFTACNGNDGEGNENPHKSYLKRDRRENSFFHRFWLRGWRSYDAIDWLDHRNQCRRYSERVSHKYFCEISIYPFTDTGPNVWFRVYPQPSRVMLWNMQLCWGYIGLFLVSEGGPGAPRCVNHGTMGWLR